MHSYQHDFFIRTREGDLSTLVRLQSQFCRTTSEAAVLLILSKNSHMVVDDTSVLYTYSGRYCRMKQTDINNGFRKQATAYQ